METQESGKLITGFTVHCGRGPAEFASKDQAKEALVGSITAADITDPENIGVAQSAAPTNGEAAGIVITGTLTDPVPVEFPKLYEASSGLWTWNGAAVTNRNYESVLLYDNDRWAIENRFSSTPYTISIASPGVLTKTAHGFSNGQIVRLATTGALPTGLSAGTVYYVVNKTTDTFQVSATLGGSAINTSGTQSGTHTVVATLGRWQAAVGAMGSPELANWTGSAVSPATGTPTLSLVAAIPKTPYAPQIKDANGTLWFASGASPDHVWLKGSPQRNELYHDFNLEKEGTEFSNGKVLQSGATWLLQTSGAAPKVDSGGRLGEAVPGSATAATWYGGSLLKENVQNFGAEMEWVTTNSADTSNLSNYQICTFLIMQDGFFNLNKLIHITVRRYNITIDFATTGGVSGFRSITLSDSTMRYLEPDRRHRISGRINGDALELTVNGVSYKLVDSRIAQLNAKTILFEQIGNEYIRVRYHRIWANAPSVETLSYQQRAPMLDELANGIARQPIQVPVGGRAGNTFGYPLIARAATPLVVAVNSNGTSNQTIWSYSSRGMPADGSQWRVRAFGRFAANSNNKLVKIVVYSGEITTGTITPSGGTFEIDAIVYRSTSSATYMAVGSIRLSNGDVYSSKVSTTGWPATTPININVVVDTIASSDVILDAAFVDYSE